MATPKVKTKAKMGRPTLYKPAYCQQLLTYFDKQPTHKVKTKIGQYKNGKPKYIERMEATELPTLASFATQVGVGTDTLRGWAKANPDFSSAVTRAKAFAEHIIVANTLAGRYNPKFAQFVARNYTDLKDVKETRDLTQDKPLNTPEQLIKRIAELDEEIAFLETQI